MASNSKRYTGPATVRQHYMGEYAVVCPKCKKEALVTVNNGWRLGNGRLACQHCSHSGNITDLIRYNVIVKRHCDECGKHFEVVVPNNKTKTANIHLACPHCGVARIYEPRNEEYFLHYDGQAPTDPVFGLSLWFQCEIRGDLFWAFNRKHLLEIADYVSSTLRERKTKQYTTMVEKLPQFIKAAKNRELIGKAVDSLLKK